MNFPSRSLVTALLVISACSEPPVTPAARVGAVAVPATMYTGLGDPERQSLFDLVALGQIVADGETDGVVGPLGRAAVRRSAVGSLPLFVGAEADGWTEGRLRESYAAFPDWELTVRHMVRLAEEGDPPAVHDSARAVASRVATEAATGMPFDSLAAAWSEEPGAARRTSRTRPAGYLGRAVLGGGERASAG